MRLDSASRSVKKHLSATYEDRDHFVLPQSKTNNCLFLISYIQWLSNREIDHKPKKEKLVNMRRSVYVMYKIIELFLSPVYLFVVFLSSIFIRMLIRNYASKPRIVWGPVPLINNVFWSRAMRLAGYSSETFTNGFFSVIHKREDWDVLIQEKYRFMVIQSPKCYLAFIESLFRYDIFVVPFSGYFLGSTPLWRVEAWMLRLAKKKIIVIPYGSDSYVYRNIRSTNTLHGLLMSYPKDSRNQDKIFDKVAYWCRQGDVVIPGMMGPDGFGRWDILTPSSLVIDEKDWIPSNRLSYADGTLDTVYVVHTPNHRGFKGTEFIMESVRQLQEERLKVELILIEKKQNSDVKRILKEEADILVEQIITGYALSGIEGMASGLPTISNLEDDTYILPFRRWSFLNECPLVSASPETLTDVLRKLVKQPKLRHQLGKAGREYVEKYHGLDSAQYMFGEVIEYLYGRRESLINLYHPLLSEYSKRKPRIEFPSVNATHAVD